MQISELPSPNFDERPPGQAADLLLLHYTGMRTLEDALARLVDPATKVSSHYLVAESGQIYRLVPEDKRAWHAGKSYWEGETNINGCSIGIEIENPGHEFGYRSFPEAQMDAVERLCLDILARNPIPPPRVLGHSDVAPERKEDPGELFPWARLAAAGIGVWHHRRVAPPAHMKEGDLAALLERLEAIGYHGGPVAQGSAQATVTAFQRHWLPEAIGTPAQGRATPKTLAAAAEISSAMRRARLEYQQAHPDAKQRRVTRGEAGA